MDWSIPLGPVVAGLDGVVLDRLWRVTGPQTAGEIHRRAGIGSLSGIRLSLERLTAQGLLTGRVVGNAVTYELNAGHLAYPALEAALTAYRPYELLRERLRTTVDTCWPRDPDGNGPSLAIYGSVARHEATTGSDVDLLLVVPDGVSVDSPAVDGVSAVLHDQVPAWTGNHAHVVVVARRDLARGRSEDDPLSESWLNDADTVLGPDVRDLMLNGTG